MTPTQTSPPETVTLCLTGDVMTGRGIDQVLPHPGNPRLHESYVRDARDYVRLAESVNGAIPAPVAFDYVWGDALPTLHRADVRIINVETSITRSDRAWPGKGIHYRMHPGNAGVLTAARIDCCSLANNHVLDWGREGLLETLATLDDLGVRHAGGGRTIADAAAITALETPGKRRVLVLALGSETSGIPRAWRATPTTPGVNLIDELSSASASRVANQLLSITQPEDVTVVSIHWGDNWGYDVPREQIAFAHRLVDEGVDIVHGHSSHHVKAIEIRRDAAILYGCGDFLTDYEGITGHEEFRGTLAAAFLVSLRLQPRRLVRIEAVPFHVRQMRMNHPSDADARWLEQRLSRECARFNTDMLRQPDNAFVIRPR